jgi:hypothetical protein
MRRMWVMLSIAVVAAAAGPTVAQIGQGRTGEGDKPTRPTRPTRPDREHEPGAPAGGAGADLAPRLHVGDSAKYRISLEGDYLLSMPGYPLSDQTVDYSETRLFSETVKDLTQDGNYQIVGQYDQVVAITMDRALSFTAADLPKISTVVSKTGAIVSSKLLGTPPLNLPIRSIERDLIYEIPFGAGKAERPGATWTAEVPMFVLADTGPPPKVKATFTLVGTDKSAEGEIAEVDVHIDETVDEARFPLPGDKPGYGQAKVVLDGTGWIRVADGRLTEQQFSLRYEAQGKVGEPSEEVKEALKAQAATGKDKGRGGKGELTTPNVQDPRPAFYASGAETRRVKLLSSKSAAPEATHKTEGKKPELKGEVGRPGAKIIIDKKEER